MSWRSPIRRCLPDLALRQPEECGKEILRGHQRQETARFIGFRSHWGFQAGFCNPGEGHEKGGVEGEGGQFRRNYLVPVPRVRNLEELNLLLAAGSREEQNRVIAGRAQSIGAGMIAEREHLLPMAEEGFDLASLHFSGGERQRMCEGSDELLLGAVAGGNCGPGEDLLGVRGDLAPRKVCGTA
jgi:hypothetical protein